MRSPSRIAAALILWAVACDDPLTAPPPRREIALHFCSAWAAYQNDGEDWTALPSVPGPATFEATERLGIATATRVGPSLEPLLEIYYLTADQAEATFTCGAPGSGLTSSKQLRGSVAGVSTGATVSISMGRNLVGASAAFPTFTVRAPRDASADLLAVHRPSVESSVPSGRTDRIILRRDEDHPDGATMPPLDFSSLEAFAPRSTTLTIGGVPAGSTVSVQTHVTTARGAAAALSYDFDQPTTVVTTQSLPAIRIVDGDLHRTNVDARGRSVLFFYRDAVDRTIALGPAPSMPEFTTPVSSSGQVMRIDIPAQSAYGAQVSIRLAPPQPSTFANTIVITATREYFGGTPTTWRLVVPDLTDVPGFSPLFGPAPGPNGWVLTVTGLPFGFSAASARDGDVYRSATASGIVTIGSGDLVALRR